MAVTWRAPGRVNLIGEHTDYNAGFALPFAIEAGCTATLARLPDAVLEITSTRQDGAIRTPLAGLEPGTGGWSGYAAGVVWVLRREGHEVPGLRITLDSSVPIGAGLSSSAALVCSVATAVDDLLGLALSEADLLALTRSVENDYVGAPTGGMDQLAALNCVAGHALFCDMRSLKVEQVPLRLDDAGLAILVVDTRARHRHADGEYRVRREACERAASKLGVDALRDISVDELASATTALRDEELERYTRHVVTENDRVVRTVQLLRAGNLPGIGPLLTQSHASMRDDYRITIAELDTAVDALLDFGALGARMTGGGFGGCVIALVPAGLIDAAKAAVGAEFAARGFAAPGSFTVRPAQGAHRVRT